MMSASSNAETHDVSGLRIWSCVICRRRKVKCDRQDPCNNCTKNNIECHFPVTGRLPRRSRDPSSPKAPLQRQAELLSRLRRLEAVVTELSAQVEEGPSDRNGSLSFPSSFNNSSAQFSMGSDHTSASINKSAVIEAVEPGHTENEMDEEFGRLVIDSGGGLQVGKGFWSIFCDEVFGNPITYLHR